MNLVSLFTKLHNQKAVDEFYCRLETPVGEEQKIRDAGFEVDQLELLNSEVEITEETKQNKERRLLLVDLFQLPRLLKSGEATWADYKIDLIGTAGSIAFVIVFLIGLHYFGLWLFA